MAMAFARARKIRLAAIAAALLSWVLNVRSPFPLHLEQKSFAAR